MRGFSTLFRLLSLRPLQARPFRAALAALNVALGVAVAFTVHLVCAALDDSFRRSIEAFSGKAALVIESRGGLEDALLPRLVALPGVQLLLPAIEARALAPSTGESLTLFGVDLAKEALSRANAFHDGKLALSGPQDVEAIDSIFLTQAFAGRRGIRLGDRFPFPTSRGEFLFTVRGILSPRGQAAAFGGDVAFLSLASARAHLRRGNEIDSIRVLAAPGADLDSLAARAQKVVGAAGQVVPAGLGSGDERRALGAYRLMLRLFGLVSLVYALLSVLGALRASASLRRRELGIARALGASDTQVAIFFAAEGALLGTIGATAGLAFSPLLARLALGSIERSLETRFQVFVHGSSVSSSSEGLVWLAIAIAFIVFFSFFFARAAARIPVNEIVRRGRYALEGADASLARSLSISALCFLPTALFGWVFPTSAWTAPAGAILISLGVGLAAPAVVQAILRIAAWALVPTRWGTVQISLRALSRFPGRLRGCVSAACVGLMLSVAVSAVNQGLKTSFTKHYERALSSDLVLTAHRSGSFRSLLPLDPALAESVGKVKGVARATGDRIGSAAGSLADCLRIDVLPGADPASVRRAIVAAVPGVGVWLNAELRAETAQALDAAFAFSRVIVWLLWILVFGGLANALSLSLLDRTAELATLRAIGAERRRLRFLAWLEGAWIGGAAASLAAILGVWLARGWVAERLAGIWGWSIRVPSDTPLRALGIAGSLLLAGLVGWLVSKRALPSPLHRALSDS